MQTPVDKALNCAILTIAGRLFPTGYDLAPEAPFTFKALCETLDSGARMVVYSGGSDDTIFADREVNYAFRAWHDWTHWRYGHDFSAMGETLTYCQQMADLSKLYGNSDIVRGWARLLYAEVVGQRTYYEIHRKFVSDQRGFSAAFLNNPAVALSNPSC